MKTGVRILSALFRVLDLFISISVCLFCLLFLLLGVYSLYDTALLYHDASDSSFLRFRPEVAQEKKTAYEDLKGSVSWLTLEGAGVDAPVMQGKDNLEYLNKNPYGEFSLSGSLFLDFRNSSDFSDPYSLIYGHHMDHHMMFGALDQYMDEEFFNAHSEGLLYTQGQVLNLKIVAYGECSAYDSRVFEPVGAENVREFIRDHSVYFREEEWNENERIVCFSTCRYPDTQSRTVVFALIKEQ